MSKRKDKHRLKDQGLHRASPAVDGNGQSGKCRVCGCTDERGCIINEEPCSWINEEHTLCSGCV
jgi:hypothetical protein